MNGFREQPEGPDAVSKRAVLIAGPTASGKSAVAMAIAREFGGVVINADSMQVYRDLRILSARPSEEDEAAAPHRLYGFVDAAEAFSTGRWVDAAADTIRDVWADGKLPIVIGGTGLYFRALEHGLAPVPEVPPHVRQALRERAAREGGTAMHSELQRKDPAMADRLEPGDRQRVLRALEVLEATGKSLREWQDAQNGPGFLEGVRTARLLLDVERAELYRRCEARFDTMISAGALEEVRALIGRDLDSDLPVMKAVGVPQLAAYLRDEIDLDDAASASKTATRQYAKRQLTWFRSNMISWNVISAHDSKSSLGEIFSIVRDNVLTRC